MKKGPPLRTTLLSHSRKAATFVLLSRGWSRGHGTVGGRSRSGSHRAFGSGGLSGVGRGSSGFSGGFGSLRRGVGSGLSRVSGGFSSVGGAVVSGGSAGGQGQSGDRGSDQSGDAHVCSPSEGYAGSDAPARRSERQGEASGKRNYHAFVNADHAAAGAADRASSISANDGWAEDGMSPRPISIEIWAALPCRWATRTERMIL